MAEDFKVLVSTKVPESALNHCFNLWEDYRFKFKLARKRVTKLGDYRFDPRVNQHIITVNSDLNQYQFLITYIHEVAHCAVHKPRGLHKPHGLEWKMKFQELMLPMLRPEIFPDDILRVLAKHMKNPKASVGGDPNLARVLAAYDKDEDRGILLSDIGIGEEFTFKNRVFRKLEKKRTRSICLDLKNKRRYLIPEMAEIKPPRPLVTPPPKEGRSLATDL